MLCCASSFVIAAYPGTPQSSGFACLASDAFYKTVPYLSFSGFFEVILNKKGNSLPGIFIVISAPSGAGKTSICRRLLDLYPNLRFSVSYTTRAPRPGEEDGKDYYFISEQSFRDRVAHGEFVEWVENYGCFYGTSKKDIEDCLGGGCDLIVDVEPRGARKLHESCTGGVFVFILPPSMAELKKRLLKRGFEGEEAVRMRLSKAEEEIREVLWYDYVIFNERLDEAVDQMRSIYVAEKSRRERLMGRISDFF
jgi:guanylate kinase